MINTQVGIYVNTHRRALSFSYCRCFANLGDVNNQLLAYEKYIENGAEEKEEEEKEEVAKSMLVLMVRGLFTKLQFA